MDCNEVIEYIYIWCIVGGWCCHILKFERYKAKKLNCYVNVVLNVHKIECMHGMCKRCDLRAYYRKVRKGTCLFSVVCINVPAVISL